MIRLIAFCSSVHNIVALSKRKAKVSVTKCSGKWQQGFLSAPLVGCRAMESTFTEINTKKNINVIFLFLMLQLNRVFPVMPFCTSFLNESWLYINFILNLWVCSFLLNVNVNSLFFFFERNKNLLEKINKLK